MTDESEDDIYPFGPSYLVAEALTLGLREHAVGLSYQFATRDALHEATAQGAADGTQVYWHQLFRAAHCASHVALLRHFRWHDACRHAVRPEPNYLEFAAALRALMQSAIDIVFAVGSFGPAVSANHRPIRAILTGHDDDLCVIPELGDRLVAFLHLGDEDFQPVLPPMSVEPLLASYCAAQPDGAGLALLAEELGHIARPGLQSSRANFAGDSLAHFTLSDTRDGELIEDLCRRHHDAINHVYSAGATAPLIALQTLHCLPLKEFHSPPLAEIPMACVPAWEQIARNLAN